jgi:DNA-binding CsgD family transcriptional regulator
MQKRKIKASSPSATYPFHHLQGKEEESQSVTQDLNVLKKWERIQMSLLNCIFTDFPEETCSWRIKLEDVLNHISDGSAQIWWEPLSNECMLESGQLIEIRYEQVRYGMLKLVPSYLISPLFPDIPQIFAQMCALLITFMEHQTLVKSLQKTLPPLNIRGTLTVREKEILTGMAFGESETLLAQKLCIAVTTVRTHRQHVYHCLNVSNPKDAVLRSFVLRLIDWLDLSSSVKSS